MATRLEVGRDLSRRLEALRALNTRKTKDMGTVAASALSAVPRRRRMTPASLKQSESKAAFSNWNKNSRRYEDSSISLCAIVCQIRARR